MRNYSYSMLCIRSVFLLNTILFLSTYSTNAQIVYEKWIASDFVFKKYDNTHWEENNLKNGDKIYCSVVNNSDNYLILFDVNNKVYIKLSNKICLYSSDNVDYKELSNGNWVTIMPSKIDCALPSSNEEINSVPVKVKYGELVNLSVPSSGHLSPGDEWVWTVDDKDSQPVGFGNSYQKKQTKSAVYYLSSKNFKDYTDAVRISILVDTNTYGPDSIVASRRIICTDSTVTLTISGGSLGKDTRWVWYDNKDLKHKIDSVHTQTVQVLKDTKTFYLVAEKNGIPVTAIRECTVKVERPSVKPESISFMGVDPVYEFCKGEKVNLSINGGELGSNANWVWYIRSIKQPDSMITTHQNSINYSIQEDGLEIYVRAENSCNITEPINTQIKLLNQGKLLSDLDIKLFTDPPSYKKQQSVLLYPSLDSKLKYNYAWLDTNTLDTLGQQFNYTVKKITQKTIIKLSIYNRCDNGLYLFNANDKWNAEEKERQDIKKHKKDEKKYSKKRKKDEKRYSKKRKKDGKRNRKEAKKVARTKNRQNNTYQADGSKQIKQKKVREYKIISGDISCGINNKVGLIGLGLEVNPVNNFSVGIGAGLSSWGIKGYSEAKFYMNSSHEGLALGVGVTYNSGLTNWQTTFETTQSPNEDVTLNLLPQMNVFAGIYYYSGSHYYSFGYSYNLGYNPSIYQEIQGNPLSTNSVNQLKLLSPGGLMLSYGIRF